MIHAFSFFYTLPNGCADGDFALILITIQSDLLATTTVVVADDGSVQIFMNCHNERRMTMAIRHQCRADACPRVDRKAVVVVTMPPKLVPFERRDVERPPPTEP